MNPDQIVLSDDSAPRAVDAEPAQASGPAWRTVAVLSALNWFNTLDRQMPSLLVAPIKRDLGLTDVQIGAIQGVAFAFFFAAASLPIGWMVDRMSRRLIVFCGTIAWSIGAAASGLARTFGQLFVARAGVGAGEATLQPAGFAILASLFPPGRLTLPMSVFVIGSNLGSGMSYIVGGLVVDWVVRNAAITLPFVGQIRSWQSAFLLTGLPGFLFAFMVFAIPDSGRTKAPARNTGRSAYAETWAHYRNHWRFYLAHHLGFAMCIAFIVGLLGWNPAFLDRHYGWGLRRIGLWLGGTQILSAVFGLSFHGWAVDRLFRAGMRDAHLRYLCVICPLAGLLAAAAYRADNPQLMLLLFGLAYFCIGGYPGIGSASLQIATPAALRGKASSIYLICLNLVGAMLGPMVIAWITVYGFHDEAAVGASMSLFALGAMALATIFFIVGLGPMRRVAPHPDAFGRGHD